MKGLLTLAWFLACSVPAVPGGLLDLKSMIEKVTGKTALTNYGFYGCYCGWGGRGTPKDGTDWCCWVHDHCYGRLEEKGCHIRTQSYKYRFARGLVTCAFWSAFSPLLHVRKLKLEGLPGHAAGVGIQAQSSGPSAKCSSVPVTGSSSTA
ncbi:phospholipase A2 group V isoform X3 [Felis catus]|nr:phospholipase A2 group V isoform X3 [Felis catus]